MTDQPKPLALVAMHDGLAATLFDDETRALLADNFHVDVEQPLHDFSAADPTELAAAEVLITSWGCPWVDDAAIDLMPNLKGIVHAAGTVKNHLTEQVWERNIRVTSAAAMNALPVAEYAVAMILLAAKGVFRAAQDYAAEPAGSRGDMRAGMGAYRRRVGLIGASIIGRRVIELLAPYDLELVLSDPFVTPAEAQTLGVELTDLETLASTCDVISLHAPLLESTRGMISAGIFALMPTGATFINTARGGIVDHDAMTAEFVSGRLRGIIDVTDPYEPLPADSPLWQCENVIITPHVAGALGNEQFRLGRHAAENAIALIAGNDLDGEVSLEALRLMA